MNLSHRSILLLGLLVLALTGTGCTKVESYSATDQFLLSKAAGEATQQISAAALRGRAVYVSTEYMKVPSESSSAMQYMLGAFRSELLTAGARLVDSREDAQIIAEVRTGGIGTDEYQFLFGIPSIPLGTVAAAAGAPPVPITSPELALIKNTRKLSTASVAYVAYWADTGELVASSGPFVGRAHREDWWFFGWGPQSISDIPTTKPLE